MSFRTRLFVAFSVAVLIPLGLLGFGVRREMERRLTAQYQRRVSDAVQAVQEDLAREGQSIGGRLTALAADLEQDNRFRLATSRTEATDRRYLLDYAGTAMRLTGLSFLQVQDSSGRIVSSGHFRNEYDRMEPALPALLETAAGSPVLVRARTAEGSLVALARLDSLRVAGARFRIVGGVEAEHRLLGRLVRDPELTISLVYPGQAGRNTSERRTAVAIPLLYLDLMPGAASRADTARLVLSQWPGTLVALRRSIDAWFLVALAVTVGLALLGAGWLAARISRPLLELSSKTAAIDLDRLDQDFSSERDDEIGSLSRLLGAMMERLRVGTARLREAERRVAMGDLARQVNHDVKNGLVPIRNVLRHLAREAEQRPESLATVFAERKATLDSSVEYLETLARNYARLSPATSREPCDVNAVVREVVQHIHSPAAPVRATLDPALPRVRSDRLVLRRILENLVGNALDSLAARPEGGVVVSTESLIRDGAQVRVVVADTGAGMSRAELDRAFEDFYTTKEGGTGLGLSIVRRLVLDLGGVLRVDTEPGTGTRVTIELPAMSDGAGTS
ncbi:MAG TPA: HAMP domain-containing sensor histidine kinase [Gemmatimonadales bacterium]